MFMCLPSLVADPCLAGCLKLREPSGDTLIIGDASSESKAMIVVNRPDFYRRIALRADLGLSEAYMHGDFDTPEMRDLLNVCALNRQRIVKQGISQRLFQGMSTAVIGSVMARMQHLTQHNKVGNTAVGHAHRAPSHLSSTPLVHASRSHLSFTPLVHASRSRLSFTPLTQPPLHR
jgi:hypothetical protein